MSSTQPIDIARLVLLREGEVVASKIVKGTASQVLDDEIAKAAAVGHFIEDGYSHKGCSTTLGKPYYWIILNTGDNCRKIYDATVAQAGNDIEIATILRRYGDRLSNMIGPAAKDDRRELLEIILGGPVPKAASGITRLRDALVRAITGSATQGMTMARAEDEVAKWAEEVIAAHV